MSTLCQEWHYFISGVVVQLLASFCKPVLQSTETRPQRCPCGPRRSAASIQPSASTLDSTTVAPPGVPNSDNSNRRVATAIVCYSRRQTRTSGWQRWSENGSFKLSTGEQNRPTRFSSIEDFQFPQRLHITNSFSDLLTPLNVLC